MKVLIKQAKIINPNSPLNGKIKDLLIVDGIITQIKDSIDSIADTYISKNDLHVSIGWMDVFANFADPGFEYKETLETGANAAAAGGFTEVMIIPNTNPSIASKSQVEYIVQKSKSLPAIIHPIGAVSKNIEGKDLAEMYDMKASGAVAFSDGIQTVQSAGLLLKGLEYVKAIKATIIQIPDDKSIGSNGLMNEGIISTQLGMQGKPSLAEELMVARDIKLARYTNSKLHFTGVTTKKSIEYIKRAKEGGIEVSCSITPFHLFFCDEDLVGYDTNLKVNPPLRTKEDRDALRQSVKEGIIDCIASHHFPHEWDSKVCEFEYAKFGMIGLESCMGAVLTSVEGITAEQWVNMMSINSRKIFGIEIPELKEGATANLTMFQPNETYVFNEQMILSKSKNSPFINANFKGRVNGTILKNSILLND